MLCVLYRWMDGRDTGLYSTSLKMLQSLSREAWCLWSDVPRDTGRLEELMFKVRIPCALACRSSMSCIQNALAVLASGLAEAECMMEETFADQGSAIFADKCIRCVIELNRQYSKLWGDLQYASKRSDTQETSGRREESVCVFDS